MHPAIDRFLAVLLKELHNAEESGRANAGVLQNLADDPVPMLRQIETGLRNRVPKLEHLANRATELADEWDQGQG
jgi:hypothetical protein